MKKWIMAGLPLLGALVISGCASVTAIPPAGSSPGVLLTEVTYPSRHDAQTLFNFSRADIELLGPITATSESQCILGLMAQGDNGYGNLMKAAKAKYPDADGIINLSWDTHWNLICLGIISKVQANVEGMAFKFKK
jgi:hypothetical protein